MPEHYILRHNQAVWETTTFTVPASRIPEGEDPVEWLREHFDELMSAALELADDEEGGATTENGAVVESTDTDINIRDDTGKMIYNTLKESAAEGS